ncbi:cupin domain-containing protein [bacterium]|nr:MAG: cupin domain-containing protein [bacterium]
MKNAFELLIPHLTLANAGDWINLGDHRGRSLISSAQSGGTILLAEVEADFLGGVSPHIHTMEDESFYILEGRFSVGVGDQQLFAGPGDTVFAPRDVSHTWRCMSENGGRLLLLVTPGENFEKFIVKMAGQAAMANEMTTFAAICAIAESHGMTMLAQPTKLGRVATQH